MAVSTADIETLYDVFLSKSVTKLTELQGDTQMEDEHFANAVGIVITGAMSNSISALNVIKSIESMGIKDAIEQAQSAKDLLLKDAQIAQSASSKALIDQQKLSEVQRTSQETYKNSTLLPDEHSLNLKKIDLTQSQKSLADRQTTGFDDKKRVEQATQASGLVGMIYASGGDVPTDAWTYAKGKVDAI